MDTLPNETTAKHTPGPLNFDGPFGQGPDVTWIVTAKDGSQLIAETYTEANAALIAAAPDLLAALKEILMVETIKNNPPATGVFPNLFSRWPRALEQARAAIARTEGRQP